MEERLLSRNRKKGGLWRPTLNFSEKLLRICRGRLRIGGCLDTHKRRPLPLKIFSEVVSLGNRNLEFGVTVELNKRVNQGF